MSTWIFSQMSQHGYMKSFIIREHLIHSATIWATIVTIVCSFLYATNRWLNHPFGKTCAPQIGSFPQFWCKQQWQQKELSNHQLASSKWPKLIHHQKWRALTLPEPNIAPEKMVSQKENNLPTINFQVQTVSSREGVYTGTPYFCPQDLFKPKLNLYL